MRSDRHRSRLTDSDAQTHSTYRVTLAADVLQQSMPRHRLQKILHCQLFLPTVADQIHAEGHTVVLRHVCESAHQQSAAAVGGEICTALNTAYAVGEILAVQKRPRPIGHHRLSLGFRQRPKRTRTQRLIARHKAIGPQHLAVCVTSIAHNQTEQHTYVKNGGAREPMDHTLITQSRGLGALALALALAIVLRMVAADTDDGQGASFRFFLKLLPYLCLLFLDAPRHSSVCFVTLSFDHMHAAKFFTTKLCTTSSHRSSRNICAGT